MTRSVTRVKREIVRTVKTYLGTVEATKGKHNKQRVVGELFEYLIKNIWFVNSHTKFKKTVRNKLIEFHINNDWSDAKSTYMRMFGEEIPTEYV